MFIPANRENADKDKKVDPVKEADTDSNLNIQSSTSIDELLNLHMSDDTIHDIVQKTSSDPAFESLFSLFSQVGPRTLVIVMIYLNKLCQI